MRAVLREHLTVMEPGPLRPRLLRMAVFRRKGRLPPNERRTIYAFHNAPERLVLPRGLLSAVRRLVPLEIRDRRLAFQPADFGWRGNLFSYQQEALDEALRRDGGVIVAPPGSGKTNMGLAAAAVWGQPTLWLVHTLELQRQALERARSLFDLPASAYSTIGEGTGPTDRQRPLFTVAMVQSLAQIEGWIDQLAPRTGAVICDEAHHLPATQFSQVMGRFPARFRLGLSATPERTDGLGPLMRALLGAQIEIPLAILVRAGRVVLPNVYLVRSDFEADPYASMRWDLLERARAGSERRNRMILKLAYDAFKQRRRVLVLVSRKDHAKALAAALTAAGVPAFPATGEQTVERRDRWWGLLERGHAVVVATKLANEGLDLPLLDTLVLGAAARSRVTLEQQIGRAMRNEAGKKMPAVFDITDVRTPAYAEQVDERLAYYEEVGYQVATWRWR